MTGLRKFVCSRIGVTMADIYPTVAELFPWLEAAHEEDECEDRDWEFVSIGGFDTPDVIAKPSNQ